MFDLMSQPYNVIHEMYRVLYVKDQLRKDQEEQRKKQEAEEAKRKEKEERERKLHQVPSIMSANPMRTPPSKQSKQEANSTPVGDITMSDLEDFIEEVTS